MITATGEGLGETVTGTPPVDADQESGWTVAISLLIPARTGGHRFLASDHQRATVLRALKGHSATFHYVEPVAEFTVSLTASPRAAVTQAIELCWSALEAVGVEETQSAHLWLIEHREFDAAIDEDREFAYEVRTAEASGYDAFRRSITDVTDISPFLIGDSLQELLARYEAEFSSVTIDAATREDNHTGTGESDTTAHSTPSLELSDYERGFERLLVEALDVSITPETTRKLAQAALSLVVTEALQGGEALATQAQLSDRLEVSKQRVHQLAASEGFPDPVMRLAGSRPVWLVSEVEAWNSRRLDGGN